MKGKAVIIFTLFAMIIFSAAIVAIAHGGAPDVITIDKAQAKKPPVVFPHLTHSETIDCADCHHTTTEKEDPQNCFDCHGKDPAAPDPSSMSSKKNPFHVLCKTCHQEKAKGPTKCAECHKKE